MAHSHPLVSARLQQSSNKQILVCESNHQPQSISLLRERAIELGGGVKGIISQFRAQITMRSHRHMS